ncbi:MAG TPA: hypothetical protein VFF70_09230 [Anaerolineae bacterium]|nr:hypothetical protein [Anaerolineae bacterium]
MDNLIRSTLQAEIMDQAPSAAVRASMLVEAAHVRSRSAVGPSIPSVANGLREQCNSPSPVAPIRLTVFSGHDVAEHWLMMIAPVHAIR